MLADRPLQALIPKLRVPDIRVWNHHCGGWNWVTQVISRHFGAANGTLFLHAVEDHFAKGVPVTEPWTGVVHQVPRTSYAYPDLHRLLMLPAWRESIASCRGLWVLTSYVRDFLR